MSDHRHCDGPECEVQAPLGVEDAHTIVGLSSYAERFIELTTRRGIYHFHNDACLRKWTAQNTKAIDPQQA